MRPLSSPSFTHTAPLSYFDRKNSCWQAETHRMRAVLSLALSPDHGPIDRRRVEAHLLRGQTRSLSLFDRYLSRYFECCPFTPSFLLHGTEVVCSRMHACVLPSYPGVRLFEYFLFSNYVIY